MSVNIKNWQELKKPNVLDIKDSGDKARKATFVAEPLERGFGLTLGNALRRVLLSSLQGAAITSIKIENVLHEFSSLAGVREDVTDIVLNVKQIALKMEGEGAKRLQLSATGPGEVKAGDIAVSGDIEIMNKDLVLCHLDDGATLNMELTADTGKGFAANTDDLLAETRKGRQVVNLKGEAKLQVVRPIAPEDDHVAVVGDNRKLVVFNLEELPELARGQGVQLQRYRDGGMADAITFKLEDGLSWTMGGKEGRTRT